MMRARVLTQAGRIDEAIDDLQRITHQQPDNLEAFVTLASLYASADAGTRYKASSTQLPLIPHWKISRSISRAAHYLPKAALGAPVKNLKMPYAFCPTALPSFAPHSNSTTVFALIRPGAAPTAIAKF